MRRRTRADNGMVENNFSRHANLYDKYALIQCLAAKELINKSPDRNIRNILDVGCGTGNYTLLLRKKYDLAHIKAVDISRDMVDVARRKFGKGGIEFIIADAEELPPAGEYDLITSNAAFQWFNDPGSFLAKYKNALREEGSILFSTFGPLTFRELSLSVKDALGKDARISSDGFPGKEELAGMMKDLFGESAVKETVIKKKYASLTELLRHIKYTGARGSPINGISLWRKTMLDRVEEAYLSNFGGIEASYQIFYCRASG
jgi:malonyl-CoA O-methyltransferase